MNFPKSSKVHQDKAIANEYYMRFLLELSPDKLRITADDAHDFSNDEGYKITIWRLAQILGEYTGQSPLNLIRFPHGDIGVVAMNAGNARYAILLLLSLSILAPGIAYAASTGFANFTITGVPAGMPWSVTINSYPKAGGGNTAANTLNSTSNRISFANLPTPAIPSAVSFSFTPVSPEYQGAQYIFNSLPVLITWNGTTTIAMHTLFNFNSFDANLTASLKTAGINASVVNGIVSVKGTSSITPLSPSAISSIYSSLSSNKITVGTNSITDEVLINNQTIPSSYGSIKNATSNSYFPAGSSIKYASFSPSSSTLAFVSSSVGKNPSYACINLTSSPSVLTQSICNPGAYPLAVQSFGGRFGINGPSCITITATLSSTLINGNKVTYTGLISAGGSTIYSLSSNQSSLQHTASFNYCAGQPLNITLDGGGDKNYSIDDPLVFPANILYYIPVNILNKQSTAVAANTPIAIGTTSSGAITGQNLNTWSSYLIGNLINTEWFYGNGTIIPSWLFGNTLNPTSNTLSTSGNVLWYLNFGANVVNELPASMTANYVIYLGFAGNTVTTQNTLINNVNDGTGPQIVCGKYAGCDDGKSVFTLYDNFHGTTLNTTVWPYSSSVGEFSVNNGLTVDAYTAAGAGPYTGAIYPFATNMVVMDAYASSTATRVPFFGFANTAYSSRDVISTSPLVYVLHSEGGGDQEVTFNGGSFSAYNIFELYATGGTTLHGVLNYGANTVTTTLGYPAQADLNLTLNNGGANFASYVQWIFMGTTPPNGITPTTTFGAIQTAPSISQPTVSNSIADVGQTETVQATIYKGSPNYAGNFLISNTVKGTTNTIAVASQSSTALSETYTLTANDVGTLTANFIGTDSEPTAFNSIPSASFSVYAAISSVTISPSTTQTIENGQNVAFTSSVSNGAPTITYQWKSGTSGCTSASSNAAGSSTSSTYTASPITTTYYCLTATDGAGESITSSATEVMVNPPLVIIPYPTSATVYKGMSVTLYGTSSGGSGTYPTYNWYNNGGCSSSISGSTNTITVSPSSTTTYCVKVTDSLGGTATNTIAVTYAGVFPISSALAGNTIYVSYGGNYLITATGYPGDTIAIEQNGVILAQQTTTVSYNYYPASVGYLGINPITFNDLTTGDPNSGNVFVYVPLYMQNATATFNGFPPGNTFTSIFYPVKFYTQSPSNSILYTLSATTPVISVTNIQQSSVSSFSVIYTSSTALTGNVYAYDVKINNGVKVNLNGYSFFIYNALIDSGQIYSGSGQNGGASAYGGGGGGGCNSWNGFGQPGSSTSIGTGGGGGCGNGGAGGAISVSNLAIQTWLANGINNYLGGASGGNPGSPSNGYGGGGSDGCYIQANSIYYSGGSINVTGGAGGAGTNPGPDEGVGGGGGGGSGVCVLAYNSIFVAGTNTVVGGPGGSGAGGGGTGGTGGSGVIQSYHYTTMPVVIAAPNTPIILQSNVLNISYIPPTSFPAGNYIFTANEVQYANSITINESIEPLAEGILNCPINLAGNEIQYFPIEANTFPISCWNINSVPSRYYLDGNENSTIPTTPSILSSGGTVLPINLKAVYDMFSPSVSFNLTSAFGLSTSSFNLAPFTFLIQQSQPSSSINRLLINASSYNLTSSMSSPVNAFVTDFFGGSFNNYTVSTGQSFPTNIITTYAFNDIWIPTSTFQNPVFILKNSTFQAVTASGSNSTRYIFNNPETSSSYYNLTFWIYQETSPIGYFVGVENLATGTTINAKVSAILLNPVSGAKHEVDDFATTPISPAFVSFQQGASYYFNVSNYAGNQLVTDYGPIAISGCSTTPCTLVIPVGNSTSPYLPSTLANLESSCTNTAGASNSINTECIFQSLNATSYTVTLKVTASNGTVTCQNTVSGSSGGEVCNSLHTNRTAYTYVWYTFVGPYQVELNTGTIGYQAPLLGIDGGIIAFILIMVCSSGFGFISKRAEMFVVGAGIGFLGSGLIGFISIITYTIGGVLIMCGMVVYMATRRPG